MISFNRILENYQVKTLKNREISLEMIDLNKLKTLQHQKLMSF
jgi:hypothetical protein